MVIGNVLIPVIAIIGIFFLPILMVILIVWFATNERRKRYQLQTELYAKALEKGQPNPADFFKDLEIKKKRNPLNTGIICIAVGIGITLFLWLSKGAIIDGVELSKASALGVIPFLIGVAFVIIHFIEKKKVENDNAQ